MKLDILKTGNLDQKHVVSNKRAQRLDDFLLCLNIKTLQNLFAFL